MALFAFSPVHAGFPSPAEDSIDARIDLEEMLIRRPAATFLVRVRGGSMTDAGIHEGDTMVVDRSIEARDGHVIVAAVGGEMTVKRLRLRAGRHARCGGRALRDRPRRRRQGRTTKGLTTNDNIPLPQTEQQLKLESGKRVLIVPGVVWKPNLNQLANYSPDELIVLATRAQLPDGIDFKGAVKAGIDYVVRNRLWEILPGQVSYYDASDPKTDSLVSRRALEEARARQAAAAR